MQRRFAVYDWHRNQKPIQEEGYATDLFAAEAVRVIADELDLQSPFDRDVPVSLDATPTAELAPVTS